jgi:hypothetical protein
MAGIDLQLLTDDAALARLAREYCAQDEDGGFPARLPISPPPTVCDPRT